MWMEDRALGLNVENKYNFNNTGGIYANTFCKIIKRHTFYEKWSLSSLKFQLHQHGANFSDLISILKYLIRVFWIPVLFLFLIFSYWDQEKCWYLFHLASPGLLLATAEMKWILFLLSHGLLFKSFKTGLVKTFPEVSQHSVVMDHCGQ